uniref:Uncharacterized protein n=1 Tax=Pithovirus LCPAC403 TaxID=2506596 RepID=A0A481ZC17_9VIRU|nr:MAG: hypothetical protein LCPAC403_00160 [Pithovirus LCPAC403]
MNLTEQMAIANNFMEQFDNCQRGSAEKSTAFLALMDYVICDTLFSQISSVLREQAEEKLDEALNIGLISQDNYNYYSAENSPEMSDSKMMNYSLEKGLITEEQYDYYMAEIGPEVSDCKVDDE